MIRSKLKSMVLTELNNHKLTEKKAYELIDAIDSVESKHVNIFNLWSAALAWFILGLIIGSFI